MKLKDLQVFCKKHNIPQPGEMEYVIGKTTLEGKELITYTGEIEVGFKIFRTQDGMKYFEAGKNNIEHHLVKIVIEYYTSKLHDKILKKIKV